MTELEQLLAEHSALNSVGSGQFSLDPRRQRELLGKLGLHSQSQAFLKLFQGLCRLQPISQVRILSQARRLSIQLDHLEPLPQPLWEATHPLGLGLLALSQEFQTQWEGQTQGAAGPAGFRSNVGVPGSALTLTISRPDCRWWHRDWTAGLRQAISPKLAWTPFDWNWDGVQSDQSTPLSVSALAIVLSSELQPGALPLRSKTWKGQTRVREADQLRPGPIPQEKLAHAVLGAHKKSWSETFFVLDGVLLEGERNLLDRPGVVAIISADGLTPALNGLELVHDSAFRQRLQGLRPELAWLDQINQKGRSG
ncbi:MAG: hypothetical protein U0931_40835 [Vulcanimicrobiota bacterium]